MLILCSLLGMLMTTTLGTVGYLNWQGLPVGLTLPSEVGPELRTDT